MYPPNIKFPTNTNCDKTINRQITNPFYQVTLQYVAPMILILYLTLMYKTMGGGSWKGSLVVTTNSNVESHLSIEPNILGNEYPSEQNKKAEEIEEAVQIITGQFSLAWQSLKHVSNYCFEDSYENRF